MSKDLASAMVVFGATGDLTQNKLYPSLYRLAKKKLLPEFFYLIGIARDELSSKEFAAKVEKDIKFHEGKSYDKQAVNRLLRRVYYISADLSERTGYDELELFIQKKERAIGHGIMRLFYLALPPSIFSEVIRNVETCKMGKALCTRDHVLSRVIVEKPFGYDYKTATELDKELNEVFNDRQIYRIDHYLGKEAVQNIFSFRFGNTVFNNLWSKKYIQEIQINALETLGLEERYSYYDGAGAVRDMLQSHLMQLVGYLCMDRPKSLSAAHIHAAKERILQSAHVKDVKNDIVAGQYRGYKDEEHISSRSKTETYIAARMELDHPKWSGVPIYLRTGKELSRKETSITIKFKENADNLFNKAEQNTLHITIAPHPSISFDVNLQSPKFDLDVYKANMHYCRNENVETPPIHDYERLLLDVISGDQALFASSKEVLYSWKAIDPILQQMQNSKPFLYDKGTLGPDRANRLMKNNGTAWTVVPHHCN